MANPNGRAIPVDTSSPSNIVKFGDVTYLVTPETWPEVSRARIAHNEQVYGRPLTKYEKEAVIISIKQIAGLSNGYYTYDEKTGVVTGSREALGIDTTLATDPLGAGAAYSTVKRATTAVYLGVGDAISEAKTGTLDIVKLAAVATVLYYVFKLVK